ncbi:RNA ligase [Pectobacterium phage POP12]|nr:RNA ligase [Pectobacterium phage POP12]
MLTANQLSLYKNLMKLSEDSEMFFKVDQCTPMQTKVRIFSYRLGSYIDWVKPDAIESRGIMFEMVDDEPVNLLSRPMEKFFNYSEVKAWQKIHDCPILIGDVLDVLVKEDGSLVSTFMDGGYVALKSKGSTTSDQAYEATSLMYSPEYANTYEFARNRMAELAKQGYTCNLEYVAPTNRIVVGYESPKLILLNIRNNDTGEYVDYADIFADKDLRGILVKREPVEITDLDEFAEYVYGLEGFEGYVVKTTKGCVKIKTNWYVNLHRTKDTLGNNKDLFMAISESQSDDLKQLFLDDPVALKKIIQVEDKFISSLNDLISTSNEFIKTNKDKSRKDFAIALGKNQSNAIIFGAVMNWYTSRDIDAMVKDIIKSMQNNFKQFIPVEYQ